MAGSSRRRWDRRARRPTSWRSRVLEYLSSASRRLPAGVAPSLGPTRTEADFLAHIEQAVATDPQAGWIFIVDNLNTHQSESLVLYVARDGSRGIGADPV